jgi:putative hydrolase of the HAD superfamily
VLNDNTRCPNIPSPRYSLVKQRHRRHRRRLLNKGGMSFTCAPMECVNSPTPMRGFGPNAQCGQTGDFYQCAFSFGMDLPALAVTFDFGQTLAALDTGLLVTRLGERGLRATSERLEAALPGAWRTYNAAVHGGAGGHPWKIFMRDLLDRAGIGPAGVDEAVDFLWAEQPRKNLWRRPVPGMIEIARDLRHAGVPIGIVSNSEGRLAELLEEMGWLEYFPVIADSGRLGIEKPARDIFLWAAGRLGIPIDRIVHVGDSLAADVEGALAAGMRAVWFQGEADKPLGPRAVSCADADETRAALAGWGLGLRPT